MKSKVVFSTSILDEALRRKREEREYRRLQMIQAVFAALDRLAEEVPFRQAVLFGSILKPYEFFDDSDIDLALEGLGDEQFFAAMGFLSRELDRDVDLVQLESHRLSGKIRQEGREWKRKDLAS